MWASRVPNVYTRAVFVLVIGFAGDSRGDKDRSAHATPHPRVADPDLVEDIVHELWSADHPPTQQEWVLLATLEPCSGDRRGIANPLHNLPHLPLICAAEPQTHPMFMQRPTTALPFHLLTTEVFRDLAAWCTRPENHEVEVTATERAAGQLSRESLEKALASCRQCGFAKLKGVVDQTALKKLSRKGVKYAKAHPRTPLLLQQIATTVEGEISERKSVWEGGRGRVAMVVPHKRPFTDQDQMEITNNSIVRSVVDRWLGSSELGVELEMYQFIVSGHHTPEQIAHNDIPLMFPTAASRERQKYHHFPKSLRQSSVWPDFYNGTATFAVRVQMPLTVDITEQNGPTIMCPGSHREDFGLRYLNRCDRFYPKSPDPDPEKRPLHRNAQALVWNADVCDAKAGRLALGTGKIGDALIYDGRLTHAGGQNKGKAFRDIVAISYSHRWWRDWSRTLTHQGNIEELKWRADFRAVDKKVPKHLAGSVKIPKASRKHLDKVLHNEL